MWCYLISWKKKMDFTWKSFRVNRYAAWTFELAQIFTLNRCHKCHNCRYSWNQRPSSNHFDRLYAVFGLDFSPHVESEDRIFSLGIINTSNGQLALLKDRMWKNWCQQYSLSRHKINLHSNCGSIHTKLEKIAEFHNHNWNIFICLPSTRFTKKVALLIAVYEANRRPCATSKFCIPWNAWNVGHKLWL